MGASQPDILLVTCHDLGRQLGCYGAAGVRSPAIDALAARGVRFGEAFAAAPQCSPSRAALATGRHPHANGVMGLAHRPFGWDLAPGERPVAQLLGAAGYETHLFGHQHVTLDVARLGFDVLHGIRDRECDTAAQVAALFARDLAEPPRTGSSPPRYAEVNLDEPHRPYGVSCTDPEQLARLLVPGFLPDLPPVRQDLADMAAVVALADDAVGRLVEHADASARRAGRELLVVLTADHGMPMPRAKCTLYDPGLEIPLIMCGAGLPAGVEVPGLASNVDVLPTLLAAAGVPAPREVHGVSLLPAIEGGVSTRAAVFAGKTWHEVYDPMRAIRTAGWKLIHNFRPSTTPYELSSDVRESRAARAAAGRGGHEGSRPEFELYDLAADPLEQRNLAVNPDADAAAVRDELAGRLERWMRDTHDPLLDGPVAAPPPQPV